MFSSRTLSLSLFLSLLILLACSSAPALAQNSGNATTTPAAKASAAANEKATPVKEVPGAKRDETNQAATPPAVTPLTPAEKQAAITEADSITAYDPAKVVGMAHRWQYYFQHPESPSMEKIVQLHNFVQVIITVIVIFVLGLLGYVCVRFRASANPHARHFSHNTMVEIIWTAIPILILVAIGIPSLRVHYAYIFNENIIQHPDLTLKVVGHQWYWSYEYPDQGIAFDSNITAEKDLKNGAPRLLTVDNAIVVPVNKVVRVQITGADVIHSWSLPAFGVKKDAVPGRLNETWFKAEKEGIYYGQCDQLCGKFHGFMPIEIHVVSPEVFDTWVKDAKIKYASNANVEFAANQ